MNNTLRLIGNAIKMRFEIVKSARSRIAILADNHFAIITHTTVPRDCIDRVTSQIRDRVLFERLEEFLVNTAAAAKDDTHSIWKQRAAWGSRAGVRDDTKHATEGRATKQLVLPTSESKDDSHLTVKEELTDTNTKDNERIKIGSNKICVQDDLAREKMQRIQPCHFQLG